METERTWIARKRDRQKETERETDRKKDKWAPYYLNQVLKS